MATVTEHGAEAMIDSWRDSFRRHPFYVPAEAALVTFVASAAPFLLGFWALRFRLPAVALSRPALAHHGAQH